MWGDVSGGLLNKEKPERKASILQERALHSWGLTGMQDEPDKAAQDTARQCTQGGAATTG